MIKNAFSIFSLCFLLLFGCASSQTMEVKNPEQSICAKLVNDLHAVFRSLGLSSMEEDPNLRDIWLNEKKNYKNLISTWLSDRKISIYNVSGVMIYRVKGDIIIRIAASDYQEEAAQAMVDYLKEYLLKNYPELEVDIKKKKFIDLS
ncbi:MAG: hypothetical protein EHM45_15785 [Desulfobacteraceae bacterium]|nr:MAG: hypothetical protein EHM45_15785 [Desulfobacteraceae bacterium]